MGSTLPADPDAACTAGEIIEATEELFKKSDLLLSVMPYLNHQLITTGFDLAGYQIKSNLGLVRGIVVRSRSLIGNIGAGLQTLVGGNITLYTELCERARVDAYRLMVEHAEQMGANAVIGVRYDANEVSSGVTEVLCYGTAVIVEQA